MNKLLRESGQSLVAFAMLLTVVLGFTGIVVDFGYPAVVGNKLQNACDASVLAAGQYLPANETQKANVESVAREYMLKNGFGADDANIKVNISTGAIGQYSEVEVVASKKVNYFLAGLFGQKEVTVTKKAKVEISPLSGIRGLVPLALTEEQFFGSIEDGENHMILHFGAGNGVYGNYGAVDFDGPGGNLYRKYLTYGYDGIVNIGDILKYEGGVMTGPTVDAITTRLNGCTHYQHDGGCNVNHYDAECSRVIYIPIIDQNSKHDAVVVGFAAFLLDSVIPGKGNKCEVRGTYLPEIVLTEGVLATDGKANPFGTYKLRMSE